MRKFHHQWFGDDKVLPISGVFGNVDKMCSPQLSERKHFVTNGLVTSMVCHVFMEIQAGRRFAKEFGLHGLTGKKF